MYKRQIFLLILLCSPVTWSADWDKGGTAYENGDYATALKEWTPLAEPGDAEVQVNFGVMYMRGQGVLQDNVYAQMWFAASNGLENATKNRNIMAEIMTPADISKAE